MRINPYRLFIIFLGSLLFVGGLSYVGSARGETPVCTGDRHYDDCGQYCPIVTTTTVSETSTTSLVSVVDPPPPPTCPTVTCDCTAGPTTIVQVSECPPAPFYTPCKRRKDGTLRCPRRLTPHRILVPSSTASAFTGGVYQP